MPPAYEPPHVFTQTYELRTELRLREQRIVDGQSAMSLARRAYQAQTGLLASAAKRVFGLMLRVAAAAVLASPLLCLVQAVMGTGLPIVIFVVVVCTFFGLLNLYLLVSAIHWLQTRHARPGPPFDRPAREHRLGRELVFEGVVRAFDEPPPATLWADVFVNEETPLRVAFGDDFLIEVEGDEPIVVRVETSLPIFGRIERMDGAALPTLVRRRLGIGPGEVSFRGAALRNGDRVRVYAGAAPTRIGPLEGFELGRRRRSVRRQRSAYREGSSAKLLTHNETLPLAIEILPM